MESVRGGSGVEPYGAFIGMGIGPSSQIGKWIRPGPLSARKATVKQSRSGKGSDECVEVGKLGVGEGYFW